MSDKPQTAIAHNSEFTGNCEITPSPDFTLRSVEDILEEAAYLVLSWPHQMDLRSTLAAKIRRIKRRQAMSDHAKTAEDSHKWAEQFFKAVSAETLIQGQVENLLAQWHADAIRDARVKGIEAGRESVYYHLEGKAEDCKDGCEVHARLAQLKRGAA